MNILIGLTYYRPHISGLTIHTQRLAEVMAKRGHKVTVLTSLYDSSLQCEEIINGVRIIRVPSVFRISKGVVMLSYLKYALQLIKEQDIVLVNLPNTPIESIILSMLARFRKIPMAAIYHCDVKLPAGILNRIIESIVFFGNYIACSFAKKIITYTDDYAENCSFLKHFHSKCKSILPPVQIYESSPDNVKAFKNKYSPNGEKIIGFAARFATEKGIEYLLSALPIIQKNFPDIKVLFAGEYNNVPGEDKYQESQRNLLNSLKDNWTFLGVLDPMEMSAFYKSCNLTVLPSINKTESFGLVQAESMLNGTPVVASDLPGVRVPIRITNMGILVPQKNPSALADAIIEVLSNKEKYVKSKEEIVNIFSLDKTISDYENTFKELVNNEQ